MQSLLHDPNVNSPANNEAARLYREHRREYDKKVAAVVQESWFEDEDEEVDENVKDEQEVEGRRDVDSMLASASWECAVVHDSFSVELTFITVNDTFFLFIIVLSYLTCHLSLDTCVPAEVLLHVSFSYCCPLVSEIYMSQSINFTANC